MFVYETLRGFAKLSLAIGLLLGLTGCFIWDVRVLHQNGDDAPFVSNNMLTLRSVEEAGYLKGLKKELDKRDISVETKYTSREVGGKEREVATLSWQYTGLEISNTVCGNRNGQRVCRVQFKHTVSKDDFPQFEFYPPTLILSVYMANGMYVGSNAGEIIDREGSKLLKWQLVKIKPGDTVDIWYEYQV